MLADFATFARYNAWANRRLYEAVGTLGSADYVRPRRAFFSSLQGTLNHIYLVDLLYQDRLEGRKTKITRLNEVLEPELAGLRAAHAALDAWYVAAMAAMPAERLRRPFPFHTIPDGIYLDLPLDVCLTNLYQHQIHHRGQAHNMLSQAGMDPPPLDFILFKHESHD